MPLAPFIRLRARVHARIGRPLAKPCRAAALALTAGLGTAALAQGAPWPDPPPNLVQVSPRIYTSGQPQAGTLEGLKARGFEAVVYLAPPTVSTAVRDEARIVGGQGLVFVNIPVDFSHPTGRDFETFAAVMKALESRRVLVHCQANLRASSMMFLYRVIAGREDPDTAWKDVERVWTPDAAWKRLIETQLRKHGVAFEIF